MSIKVADHCPMSEARGFGSFFGNYNDWQQVLQQITPEQWQFTIFLHFHSGSFIL
jgi:hypothetical protein